jgi:D-xylose transport system substrate-binding protein
VRKLFRGSTVLLAVAVLGVTAMIVSGATAGTKKKGASVQVCVLLPDTKSSVRWVQFDAPDFAKALKAAGVLDHQRAERSPEAEGAGFGMPGRRRQGGRRDRA